jgi:hypothetical protein
LYAWRNEPWTPTLSASVEASPFSPALRAPTCTLTGLTMKKRTYV